MSRIEIGRTVAAKQSPAIEPPTPLPQAQVITMPALNEILSDAYAVLRLEMRHYRKRSQLAADQESALSPEEARTFGTHVRSLVMITTEEREARKVDDALSKLTDEQLVKLASAAIKALQGGGL